MENNNNNNSDGSGSSWSRNLNEAVSTYVVTEILPVIAALILIIVILTGAVTQTLLITALKKAGKLNNPTYKLILHASIQDILALFLVASPNFVTACVGYWPFRQGLCVLQGVFVTTLYIMTLSICVWMAIERCLKLTKSKWWTKTFEDNSGRIHLIIIVIQWILSVIYAVLPISGVSKIEYQENGFQCDRTHSDSAWLMNVHFVFTYGIPLVTCLVLFSMLLFQRVKQAWLPEEDVENLVDASNARSSKYARTTSQRELIFSTLQEDQCFERERAEAMTSYASTSAQNAVPGNSGALESERNDKSETNAAHRPTSGGPGKRKRNLVKKGTSMWDINRKADDHRLASTVMLSTVLIFLFWLPYVTVAYLYTYHDSSIAQWRGFYTLAMIFATVAYVIRPLTYVIHNKVIRGDVRALFPEKVITKYHHYNDKRKEKMSAIKEKLTLPIPQVLKSDSSTQANGIASTRRHPSKHTKKSKQKQKVRKGDLPSTPIEELEMSQFRERDDVDRETSDLGDDDPWMSVIEEGSIPEK